MNRPARCLALLVPLVLLVATGCAMKRWTLLPHSSYTGNASDYFLARGLDFVDIFPASVAYGYGVSVQFRATPMAGIGFGYTDNWRAGTGENRFGPVWWEKERGLPFYRYYRYQDYRERTGRISGGNPIWWEQTHRLRASTYVVIPGMAREGDLWFPMLPPYFLKVAWEYPRWSSWSALNVEAGVFVGVAGLRVAVSPLEMLDFLFGLFTLDPANDDPRPHPPQWPEPGAEPSFEPGADGSQGAESED